MNKYNFELVDLKKENGEILKELNIYFGNLIRYLWEEPKLVANLLSTAKENDLKEYLAPLISNNFYENILSPNYIEDKILYIITLLLKEEINNIKKINDYNLFLEDSPCGILLEQLTQKKDIQKFFKDIIKKEVEKLEVSYYNQELIFNLEKIEENIQAKENPTKDNEIKNLFLKIKKRKSDIIRISLDNGDISSNLEDEDENDVNKKILFESKLLNQKYFINLTKEKIIEEKEKYNKEHKNENEKNDIFYNIYINKITLEENEINKICEKNFGFSTSNMYNNENFLISLEGNKKTKKIYLDNFYHVIEIINQILSNILNNLNCLTYSVKILCKIISILIKKNFQILI